MDQVVVDEEAAVLDHLWHDRMIQVDGGVVVLLNVLSDDFRTLAEQGSM